MRQRTRSELLTSRLTSAILMVGKKTFFKMHKERQTDSKQFQTCSMLQKNCYHMAIFKFFKRFKGNKRKYLGPEVILNTFSDIIA